MTVYPIMDIHFPASAEQTLVEGMKARAAPPWSWQAHDAFGRNPQPGTFFFHRDQNGPEPPCTLCVQRCEPGHLEVPAIVPDEKTVHDIPINQYVQILQEFDRLIAAPASQALKGITSLGTSKHTLEDYFPAEAIRLLEHFCKTSTGYGSDPRDQEKWMDFLLYVHRHDIDVQCDTFGACLRSKDWWSEDGIPRLVQQHGFALRLLRHAEGAGQ